MRTYGRTAPDEFGNRRWVEVDTDAQGYNDYVYITALIQCLKLNLGESPFYANFGIPAKASVQTQIEPDVAVNFTQSYFAQFFASLIVSKRPGTFPPVPTYDISVIRNNGSLFQETIAL